MQKQPITTLPNDTGGITKYGLQRRNMLKFAGASAALIVVGSACNKNDNPSNGGIDLGSGDVGILNYAYALEQLEAAFYTQVVATPYSGISALESEYLTDIRNHEVAHREFFKAAITAAAPTAIIPGLQVNFSSINFASRDSVLATAMAFEDLGVSAYNGAGQLISSSASGKVYLGLAGKIVSVEARHAALIRDLISNGTFANTTDTNGLDTPVRTPAQVLAIASAYLTTKLDASHLPS
ncbi:MAG: ferritin-like domain-containing protein [Ferruginibacter sp.]